MQAPLVFQGTCGPRVLLLHGFLGTPEDWSTTWECSQKIGQWTAVWLPGHGATPSSCCLKSFAQSLVTLSEGKLWDLCLGYSMGGRIALQISRWGPVWKKLCLISTHPRQRQQGIDRFALDLQRAHDLTSYGVGSFLQGWYQQSIFHEMHPSAEFLQRRHQHHPVALAEVLWKWSPARLRPLRQEPPVERVVMGELDPWCEDLPHLQRTAHPVPIDILPKASHHLMEMAPAGLAHWIDQRIQALT